MAGSAYKLAILHDDAGVAAHVAELAAEAGLAVHVAGNTAGLEEHFRDPALAAVVVDFVGPNSGGLELLEKLSKNAPLAMPIVITALDTKTIESTRRVAVGKGLELTIFRKDALTDADLRACMEQLTSARASFSAEDLADALAKNCLYLEYQPKIPLGVATAAAEFGVEALCRLKHPEFGVVFPDQFIAIAESEDLIADLTDRVVQQAFTDWRIWRDQGLMLRLAINISPELLRNADWCESFLQRCAEYEMDPAHVILEITESSQVTSQPAALDVLTKLRLKGFTLSIDDFGTGFSSLQSLYKLPFGELKIDKTFTLDLGMTQEAGALIESSIGMAKRLGVRVCAEGVESQAAYRALQDMDCGYAQGFFISRPIAADKIPGFFASWAAPAQDDESGVTMPGDLPKIAMIQWLMRDILSDDMAEADKTVVFSKSERDATEDSTLNLARKIPSLVLQQKVPAAIAQCHAVAERLNGSSQRNWQTKIAELQRLLEFELLCRDDLELQHAKGIVRLLPRRSLLIGRASAAKSVDVAIACRWLSRGDKNLKLFVDREQWFAEDLGSTNGIYLDGQRLVRGRPIALAADETVLEIGKAGAAAPLTFRFRRPRQDPTAMIMNLVANPYMEGSETSATWPNWREDVRIQWLFFPEKITAGRSPDCALALPDCGTDKGADISFANGFWIAPREGAALTISDVAVRHKMPLPAGQDINIGGSPVTVRLIPEPPVAKGVSEAQAEVG